MVPRYQLIAQRIAGSIEHGVLHADELLPSLRNLCESEGVSLMTALAAYRRLEAQGLVEARPRSGFRVRSAVPRTPPHTAAQRARVTVHSARRDDLVASVLAAAGDPKLVPLGLGIPSPDLLPVTALRRLTARVLAAEPNAWVTYSLAPGNPELRRLVAQRLQARGLDVDADDIVLTNGAMEGLSLSLRALVKPGAVVAVECPTFFGILDALRSVGARVLELPGDPDGGVDPDRLERVCRRHSVSAAVLIPSFANPTGSVMTPSRKVAWAQVLHRHGVALVEDDLYAELSFDGHAPKPLSAYRRQEGPPSILVGSFSKMLLPGGRVGYVVARRPWLQRLNELKRRTTMANATLPECVAAEAVRSGLLDRHLRRFVPRLQTGVRAIQEAIHAHFPVGTRVNNPSGGFVAWVELPEGGDGLALCRAALDEGISIAPGRLFSLGEGLNRFIRLNAAAGGNLEAALAKVGRLAHAQNRVAATQPSE